MNKKSGYEVWGQGTDKNGTPYLEILVRPDDRYSIWKLYFNAVDYRF